MVFNPWKTVSSRSDRLSRVAATARRKRAENSCSSAASCAWSSSIERLSPRTDVAKGERVTTGFVGTDRVSEAGGIAGWGLTAEADERSTARESVARGVGAAPVTTGSRVGISIGGGGAGVELSEVGSCCTARLGSCVAASFTGLSRGSFRPSVTNWSLLLRLQNAIKLFRLPRSRFPCYSKSLIISATATSSQKGRGSSYWCSSTLITPASARRLNAHNNHGADPLIGNRQSAIRQSV